MRIYTTKLFCLLTLLWVGIFFTISIKETYAQTPPTNEVISESETDGEFSAFDFYVGDNYYGLAYGYFTDKWFSFDNIEDTINLLPQVTDKNRFAPLFTGRIPQERDIENVGDIEIDFNRFRIDIEIDQKLSLTQDADILKALPLAKNAFSFQNKLIGAGSMSMEDGFDSENLTLTHETAITHGRTSFISSGSSSSAAGYEVTDAALNQELRVFGQDMISSIGLLETPGQNFSRNVGFYGFNLLSNERLLFRDEQEQASRVEIFLKNRSLVEVFRDSENAGRTIYSRTLDFGTIVLDTRSFPDGSYNIEIVITDSRGGITRETRPFIKSNSLLPIGKSEINIAAGILRDDLDIIQDQGVIFGSYRRRLFDNIEAGISGYAVGDETLFEASLKAEHKTDIFGFKGLVESKLLAGMTKDAKLTGLGTSLLWTGDKRSIFLSAQRNYDQKTSLNSTISPFLSGRDALNLNASSPLTIFTKDMRLNFNAEWSNTPNSDEKYRYGPQLTVPLFTSPTMTSELKLQHIVSRDDNQTFASVIFKHKAGAFQQNHGILYRDDDTETALIANAGFTFDGVSGDYEDWRKNLKAFLGLRLDPFISDGGQETTFADSEVNYTNKWANLRAFFNNNLTDNTGRIGGEFKNSLLWSQQSGFKASGNNISPDNAYAIVKLTGAEHNKVGLTLNGSTKLYGQSGETLLLQIPIYTTVKLGAFVKDGESYKIEQGDIDVTGYPGNITYKEFNLLKTLFIFGQLTDAHKAPLDNARFTLGKDAYYTDESGFFYIEHSLKDSNTPIIFNTQNKTCEITVPQLAPDQIIYEADIVTCLEK